MCSTGVMFNKVPPVLFQKGMFQKWTEHSFSIIGTDIHMIDFTSLNIPEF